MKYCVKCGAEMADDAIFCQKCGQKAGSPVETKEQKPTETKGNGVSIFSMVAGIVACAVSFIAYFVFGWLAFIVLPLAIVGLVFGAKNKSYKIGKAGMILCIVGVALSAVESIIMIAYYCS